MFTTSLAALAAFASLALAQNTTVTVTEVLTISSSQTSYVSTSLAVYTTPVSSVGTPPKNIDVKVGDGALAFDPTSVEANVGDTITFHYFAKNHSTTQSSFSQPCISLLKSTGIVGIDLGFHPTSVSNPVLNASITVKDLSPTWFYCAQVGPPRHCTQGMVFAVNPSAEKTFAAFQALAKSADPNTGIVASSGASGSPSGSSGGASGGSGSTGTITGGAGSGTASADNGASTTTDSGAISTSVNVGLVGVLSVVGFFMLAL